MKTLRWTYLLVLLFAFWSEVELHAQILSFDVEAITADSTRKDGETKGMVALHYDIRQQVQQFSTFSLKTALSRKSGKNLTTVSLENRITSNGGDGIQNNGFAIIRYMYEYEKTFYPEVFSQYQYDRQRGMVSRILFGANIRSTVVRKEKLKLFVALGFMNENETWDFSGVPSERVPALHPEHISTEYFKTNLYVKFFRQLGEKSSFLTSFYVQFRPDVGLSTTRFSPQVTLNVHLVNEFYFTTTFAGIYDYAPIVPIDNFYYALNNSLVFRF